jgi:protein-disulfide isomerase
MPRPSFQLTEPLSPVDHVLGPEHAPVTVVEYGDFECPHCKQATGTVKLMLARFGPQVRFAFRHFPLEGVHPHAFLAAEAAECAGGQGRFWEMHDLLFEHQDRLGLRDLIGYAGALDLDLERFVTDLRGHAHADRLREDFLSGVRSGVNGTPTFFVNGIRHDGGYDAEALLDALRGEL